MISLERLSATLVFKTVIWVFLFALVAVAVVLVSYFTNFHGPLSDSATNWGAFGDFVGGVLNPLIGMFALFALLLTLVLQAKELEATREELRRSAAAQEAAAESTARQSEALELSNRLSALTTLVSHADTWYASHGHVPQALTTEFFEWMNKRRPQLVSELEALYKKEFLEK